MQRIDASLVLCMFDFFFFLSSALKVKPIFSVEVSFESIVKKKSKSCIVQQFFTLVNNVI